MLPLSVAEPCSAYDDVHPHSVHPRPEGRQRAAVVPSRRYDQEHVSLSRAEPLVPSSTVNALRRGGAGAKSQY